MLSWGWHLVCSPVSLDPTTVGLRLPQNEARQGMNVQGYSFCSAEESEAGLSSSVNF